MKDYRDLEEDFADNESEIEIDATCPECGSTSKETVVYDGVVSTDGNRKIGTEKEHEWTGEYQCKRCGYEGTVTHSKYEYPWGAIGHEITKVE